jgi:hypothetical protein
MDMEQSVQVVQRAVDALSEHFDSVQVFVSRHDGERPDQTLTIQIGAGNWFTRLGQVRDWLIKQDELARIEARSES